MLSFWAAEGLAPLPRVIQPGADRVSLQSWNIPCFTQERLDFSKNDHCMLSFLCSLFHFPLAGLLLLVGGIPLRWLIYTANLTESGITMETNLWACLD